MAEQFHTLVVRVENKPGVLARVSGLFARRGFNIQSLAVAPTDNELFSRLTIVVDAESAPMEQVVKQLDKLINVVRIQELSPGDSVSRELILATVNLTEGSEDNIMRVHNRCSITGRPRAYSRRFGVSRLVIRRLAHRGELPGVRKSSW